MQLYIQQTEWVPRYAYGLIEPRQIDDAFSRLLSAAKGTRNNLGGVTRVCEQYTEPHNNNLHEQFSLLL